MQPHLHTQHCWSTTRQTNRSEMEQMQHVNDSVYARQLQLKACLIEEENKDYNSYTYCHAELIINSFRGTF